MIWPSQANKLSYIVLSGAMAQIYYPGVVVIDLVIIWFIVIKFALASRKLQYFCNFGRI